MMILTGFFHVDVETNVHLLPVLWDFIYGSLCYYACSCTHIRCILTSDADVASSGSWFTAFKVPALNVVIWTKLLNISNFSLDLGTLADFLNTGSKTPTLADMCLVFEWWCSLDVRFWSRVMVTFHWIHLSFNSSSFLTKWFASGLGPMNIFHPTSKKIHCWPVLGFIRLTSYPPLSFPWFLLIYTCE